MAKSFISPNEDRLKEHLTLRRDVTASGVPDKMRQARDENRFQMCREIPSKRARRLAVRPSRTLALTVRGPSGGGSVLLRCGIKPGDQQHIQGSAVGVQGSETIPALMHAGPRQDVPSPGEPRAEKEHASHSLTERKSSTEGLTQKTAGKESKRSTEVEHRRQEVNVHVTQSYQ